MSASKLYKALMNELRLASRDRKLNKESLPYKYITKQFEKYQTTDEVYCKARDEMKFVAETYLTYLRSSRKYLELQKDYKGQGERSVKDTADMVGFKLPHDPK